MSKRGKSSQLWNFFEPFDENYATCNKCKIKLSYKTSTSNLKKHITTKHPTLKFQLQKNCYKIGETHQDILKHGVGDNEKCSTEPSTSAASISFTENKASKTIYDVEKTSPAEFSLGSEENIDRKLLEFFIRDLQPFSIIEGKALKKFVNALNPAYQMPGRKEISNILMPALYNECLQKVRQLVEAGETVSISTETWTSINETRYVAVTAHFIDENFQLNSFFLESSACDVCHTSENLATDLIRITRDWGIENKIVFAVSDNDAILQGALQHTAWKSIECVAHSISLTVKDGLAYEDIEIIIGKVQQIVSHFKSIKTSNEKLMNYQMNLGNNPMKLFSLGTTGWNSIFYMLERFIQLEEAIKSTTAIIDKELPILTPSEWQVLKELCLVLKPFEQAIKTLSSEKYCTSSHIIPLYNGLMNVLNKLQQKKISEPVKQTVSRLISSLQERLGNVETIESLSVSTFLDPKFKQMVFSNPLVSENVRKYLIDILVEKIKKEIDVKMGITQQTAASEIHIKMEIEEEIEEEEEFSIWESLEKSIASNSPKETSMSRAILEMQRYLEEDILPRNGNSFSWWQERSQILPHLSKIAQQKLCTLATAVPCERLFSKTGQTLTERRNRVSARKVQMLLFLHNNIDYIS